MQVHVCTCACIGKLTWGLLTATGTLIYHMMSMVKQKAIIFPPIVAEKVIAISAIPYGLVANMVIVIAVVTSSPLLCSPHKKMCLTESFDGCTLRWTTASFPAARLFANSTR